MNTNTSSTAERFPRWRARLFGVAFHIAGLVLELLAPPARHTRQRRVAELVVSAIGASAMLACLVRTWG